MFDDLDLDNLLNIDTQEKAEARINKCDSLSAIIEDMAFRQTVLHVLLLAGIVTENDFNASLEHFKKENTAIFAEQLLLEIQRVKEIKKKKQEELEKQAQEAEEWVDDKNIGKA